MATVKCIYDFLDKIAPFESAMDFDNCGILVGDKNKSVEKILLALDITSEVVEEAQKTGAELIISHHPVIFKGIKNLEFNTPVSLLCKFGISAICAHTNLDLAKEGVNFHLAKKIGLENLSSLAIENGCSLGLIGDLSSSLNCKEFAETVKEKLDCNGVRYTFKTDCKINKVAVCSGTGGEFVELAKNLGADVFVTGEIKHSQILKANEIGLMVVDAGHFKTENVVIKPLYEILQKEFAHIEFNISETCSDHIEYL